MRIELRSVGGFTGPAGAEVKRIDTEKLSKSEAQKIIPLIESAHLFDQPEQMKLSSPKSWDFKYTLTVDDGKRRRVLEFHKSAAPLSLQELVDEIEEE